MNVCVSATSRVCNRISRPKIIAAITLLRNLKLFLLRLFLFLMREKPRPVREKSVWRLQNEFTQKIIMSLSTGRKALKMFANCGHCQVVGWLLGRVVVDANGLDKKTRRE